jgi:hypothetical protein
MLQFGANLIPASRSSSACQSDLQCRRRARGFWAVQRRSQRLSGRREPRSRRKFSGYTKTDGIPLVVAFGGASGTKERGTRPRNGSHKLHGASRGVRLHTIPTPCLACHRGLDIFGRERKTTHHSCVDRQHGHRPAVVNCPRTAAELSSLLQRRSDHTLGQVRECQGPARLTTAFGTSRRASSLSGGYRSSRPAYWGKADNNVPPRFHAAKTRSRPRCPSTVHRASGFIAARYPPQVL